MTTLCRSICSRSGTRDGGMAVGGSMRVSPSSTSTSYTQGDSSEHLCPQLYAISSSVRAVTFGAHEGV